MDLKNLYEQGRGEIKMQKRKDVSCTDDKDILHHLMEEQIAYICVEEEEERMKEETMNSVKSD